MGKTPTLIELRPGAISHKQGHTWSQEPLVVMALNMHNASNIPEVKVKTPEKGRK